MSLEEDDETERGESTAGPGEPVESKEPASAAGADLPAEFQNLLEGLRDSATAGAIFGDPVERAGRTVIPVARVGFGFGGGSGTEPGEEEGEPAGGGVGMGGGLMARPVGALEVTDEDTRFVPVGNSRRRTAVAAVVAFLAGWLLARAVGGDSGGDEAE